MTGRFVPRRCCCTIPSVAMRFLKQTVADADTGYHIVAKVYECPKCQARYAYPERWLPLRGGSGA